MEVARKIPKKRKITTNLWSPDIENIHALSSMIGAMDISAPTFLRERQRRDYDTIRENIVTYDRPLVITKPTGTGKTAVFISVANTLSKTGVPIIIIVPTITLVHQTFEKFQEYSQYLDISIDDVCIFSPTERKTKLNRITILCQASFTLQVKKSIEKFQTKDDMLASDLPFLEPEKYFHPETMSVLIFDEGHHIIGKKTMEFVRNTTKMVMLFSASTTPGEYVEVDRISRHIVTYHLCDSIQYGELSPIQFLTIDFSMYESAKMLARTIRQYLEYKDTDTLSKEAADAISNVYIEQGGFSLTPINVTKQIFDSVASIKKVMVFANTIEHANYLAKMFTLLFEIPVVSYHSNTENRDLVLRNFRNGVTRIIVAVNALDEGFDDADVNLILDFSVYVKRTRKMVQRIGRALRLRSDGSSAVYLSVKILPEDMQLLPCNYITHGFRDTHINVPEEHLLDERRISMTLPPDLSIEHEGEMRQIKARGAAVTFPMRRRQLLLGDVPVELKPETETQLEDDLDFDIDAILSDFF